ncbi:MAG: hypothetical protein PHC90_12935 [Syntrophorhabdaceae bacterium]|nr:hypothetical protein [Syntrophorhabdaceae bacterium]
MRVLLLLVLIFMPVGCSILPGQPKDTGFLTKHVSTSLPVTRTYANLRQGFRYCDFADIGVPDCKPPEKDGAVFCNVYTGDTTGKANRVLGTIQLSPESNGTKAVLRVKTYVANSEDILTAWEILMSGKVREACP